MIAARKIGPTDGTREEDVTGQHHVGESEHHRALGVPRSMVDRDRETGHVDLLGVGDGADVTRLLPAGTLTELLLEHRDEHGVQGSQRVGQSVRVITVDQGRDVVGPADGSDRVDVIRVAMRQQHGCRSESVFGQRGLDGLDDSDPGVDDDAFLTSLRRHHVAISVECRGRDTDDQHAARVPAGVAQRADAPIPTLRLVASKSKREKHLAAQKAARQRARREQQQARRARRLRLVASVAAVALVLASAVGVGFLLTNESGSSESPAAGPCQYSPFDGPQETQAGFPDGEPNTTATTATVTLNGEPVVIELETETAGCTVNSWAHLADQDYYDGTECHRLTTSDTLQVLQCGDPTATGQGGPGYRFPDEGLDGVAYPGGTVAMANSGPDSNGSQFFIVWGDTQLPPSYTVVGTVSAGLDVVTAIAAGGVDGDGTDGRPATPAVVDDVEVSQQ